MNAISKNRRLAIILLAVPALLLIPFISMQFTHEIDWSLLDFAVMGGLLTVAGLFIELVLRKIKIKENRIALLAIIISVFLLVWAELAVGIFGTPFAGS
ncbi:MAG TPA: hypothetical protein PK335_14195 [Draconibacterium sp.]|nr:hypothetical protein [Draconibacterium sp.]